MRNATPQEVTTAVRNILAGAPHPKSLTADRGLEFQTISFPKLMSDRNVTLELKDPEERNAIATVD